MIGRKIQGFEIVVIGLDHWPLGHGVAELLENANHLVRRLDDRMLRTDGTPKSRQSNVDAPLFCLIVARYLRPLHHFLNPGFQLIHTDSRLTLCILGSALQPQIIDLRHDPIFAS